MPSPNNTAIIAAAGSLKTQTVIDGALANGSRRVLVTTYTRENLHQIARRIEQREGVIPPHIRLAGWFTFLLSDGIRPYQHSILGAVGLVRGLNFEGSRNRFARRGARAYYLDSNHDVYRGGISDFACAADAASGGKVIRRLEALFDHIYIDEVQDLAGYDLEFLDLLFKCGTEVTVVGDPRQHTLATNRGSKNNRYRGAGLPAWFDERLSYCTREDRNESSRCNQAICDFASELFPHLEPIRSARNEQTGHDGIVVVKESEVEEYVATYRPTILRDSRRTGTLGLPAMNIGVAKGSTFDRVLIFPTRPMRRYLEDRDASRLKAPERLYVAVTRARHSVAFVV
jgi:DNA helicase II / ATP-dependent DNA helicase PcrA